MIRSAKLQGSQRLGRCSPRQMTRQPQSSAESKSGRRSNVLSAGGLGTIAFGEKSPVGVTNNPSTILLWWMRLLGFLTMWNSYRATTPFVEKPWRSRFQVGYRPTTKSWSSNAPCTNLIAKLGECCHYGATATTTRPIKTSSRRSNLF